MALDGQIDPAMIAAALQQQAQNMPIAPQQQPIPADANSSAGILSPSSAQQAVSQPQQNPPSPDLSNPGRGGFMNTIMDALNPNRNDINAARPVSRTNEVEHFLGNIFGQFSNALGQGLAGEGHGPGAALRGAGIAMGAPREMAIQNAQLQSQLQAQQAQTQETQARTGQVQAQTGQIGKMGMIQTPNGPMYVPLNQIGKVQGDLLKGSTAANINANARIATSRFKTTPAGVFDTQTKSMIPNTANGVTITPEMAQEFHIPSAYVGTQMKLSDLEGQEKALTGMADTQKSDNKFILDPNTHTLIPVTDTSVTKKVLPGGGGAQFSVNGQPIGSGTTQKAVKPVKMGGGGTNGGGSINPIYLGGNVLALNPQTNQLEVSTSKDAAAKGLQIQGNYTPAQFTADRKEQTIVNDLSNKISQYQSSMAAMKTTSQDDRNQIATILNDQEPKIGALGMDTAAGGWGNILARDKAYRDLSKSNPAAAKAMTDYLTARSMSLELQKLETGSSRMSELGMRVEMNQLPRPGIDNDNAQNAFGNLNKQLDTWQAAVPKLPGMRRRGEQAPSQTQQAGSSIETLVGRYKK